jgi:hypothetical protein
MLQLSKLIKSRDEWRVKAIQRATENREYRKADKRHRQTIAALHKQNAELSQSREDFKKNS